MAMATATAISLALALARTPPSLHSLRTRPSLLPLCPPKASTLPSFTSHPTSTPPPPPLPLRFRPMTRTPRACNQAPPPSADHGRPSPEPPTWKKYYLRGVALIDPLMEFALTGALFSLSRRNGSPLWFSFIVAMALNAYFRAKKEAEAHDTIKPLDVMFDRFLESEAEHKREIYKCLHGLLFQINSLRELIELRTKQSK